MATIERAVNTAVAKNLINQFCIDEYGSEADLSDISRIALAYTDIFSDRYYSLQVYADLLNFRIITEYTGEEDIRTDIEQYESLEALIENELRYLDFDSLVCGLNEFE